MSCAFIEFKKYLFFVFFFSCSMVHAQQDTTQLQEVILSATLIKTNLLKAPTAISLVKARQIQPATPQLSLKEYLGQVPGLFAQNQYNYNQDLRIAIRGFGARAAFGIRGVQIVVDGIPETTPDGQGQLDNVPLGIIENIEVLRGPSGALYGNAAGGVIKINTLDSLEGDKIKFRSIGGAFGLSTQQLSLGFGRKKWTGVFFYNQGQATGYRTNAAFKQRLFNAKISYRPRKRHRIMGQFNLADSPYAQDPGGLKITEAENAPSLARAANVLYKSSETIGHIKAGLSHEYSFTKKKKFESTRISSYLFAAKRDFTGLLPFKNGGVSSFERAYYGFGTQFSIPHDQKGKASFFGMGHAQQEDYRSRYENLEGKIGAPTESQTETYGNTHFFLSHKTTVWGFQLNGSVRFDKIKMGVPAIYSFKEYGAWSKSFSIGRSIKKNEFINFQYGESFETPTLSEATSIATGTLGFSRGLSPIQSRNYELLYRKKRLLGKALIRFELAAFISQSQGEILPYELEAFPGRSFFKNIGKTNRKGIEAMLQYDSKALKISTSYTLAHYTFKNRSFEEVSLKGNLLPGIPKHQLNSVITVALHKKSRLRLQYDHIGQLMANNENTVTVAAYGLMHVNVFTDLANPWGGLRVIAGINNLGNARYFDNIRINAFGGRYYEPAPTRNGYVGLEISL